MPNKAYEVRADISPHSGDGKYVVAEVATGNVILIVDPEFVVDWETERRVAQVCCGALNANDPLVWPREKR